MRFSLLRSVQKVSVILAFASVTGASTVDVTISEASCQRLGKNVAELRIALQADARPRQAGIESAGWHRKFVLELAEQDANEESINIWQMDDWIERVMVPLPSVRAALSCFEYGAGRDLYAAVMIFKSDWLEEWDEAWFLMMRLPVGRQEFSVVWQEYIPRMPLRRGGIAGEPLIHFFGKSKLVVFLGGRGSRLGPALLFADLSRKTLRLYPGDSTILLGGETGPGVEGQTEFSPSPEMKDKWMECRSLTDCVAQTDYCGRLVGVSRSSIEPFLDWSRASIRDCGSMCSRMPGNTPSVACVSGQCTIQWSDPDAREYCNPS